ncbi:FMN-binding negative transcriptional regulator [Kangiella sp. TOML190]|uniref:FMN-binding negative transcriptional regulator n=1 Tax=Kangiella sp. TOML190 TaxID=2931351 RepID=UPI00203FE455|nr:FMN-binding negative transcriptional regulator [Kangiella sp. TOML190]
MGNSNYPPSIHLEDDIKKLTPLMRQFPFATVISVHQGEIEVTQAPLVFQEVSGRIYLYGHLAGNNAHGDYLANANVTVIFHGPNCYISPNDYATKQLPTWNSLSVHIKGNCQTTKDPDELYRILEMMADQFEEDSPSDKPNYKIQRTEEKTARLILHITGFKIEVTEIIGRYKLSKDKTREDIQLAGEKLKKSVPSCPNEVIDHLIQ